MTESPSSTTPEWDQLGLVRRRGLRGWFRRHTGWMNAVVVVGYLLVALWGLPMAWVDMDSEALLLLVGYGAIGAILFLRHFKPLTVLVLVAVFEAAMLVHYPWHGAQMIGLSLAAYVVGYHYRLRWGLLTAVPVSLFAYLALLRAGAWEAQHGPSFWVEAYSESVGLDQLQWLGTVVVIMVFTVGIATGVGAAVRRGHEHEREILDWARRSRQLAQAGERNRIAREMHDVVAHSLSVMISLSDGARVVVRKDADRAAEVLEELASTGRSALADMRRVIGVLQKGEDVTEARRPVQESLDELYEGFRQAGMPLRVTHRGPVLPEDAAFGLTVHRIIQESLTNVLRYGSSVSRVDVAVEHQPASSDDQRHQLTHRGLSHQEQGALGLTGGAQVILTITDDGLAPAGGRHAVSVGSQLGIKGMQERAEVYNGSVYAGAQKHRGWQVRAVLEPPETTSAARTGEARRQQPGSLFASQRANGKDPDPAEER